MSCVVCVAVSPGSRPAGVSVVVVFDGYDVLVTRNIARIGSFLAESATPVVYCAESGVHPDHASQ